MNWIFSSFFFFFFFFVFLFFTHLNYKRQNLCERFHNEWRFKIVQTMAPGGRFGPQWGRGESFTRGCMGKYSSQEEP